MYGVLENMSLKYEVDMTQSYSNKKLWYLRHGQPHRKDDFAMVYSDGEIQWRQYGRKHRSKGPAVIWGRYYEYWINGVQHEP